VEVIAGVGGFFEISPPYEVTIGVYQAPPLIPGLTAASVCIMTESRLAMP